MSLFALDSGERFDLERVDQRVSIIGGGGVVRGDGWGAERTYARLIQLSVHTLNRRRITLAVRPPPRNPVLTHSNVDIWIRPPTINHISLYKISAVVR